MNPESSQQTNQEVQANVQPASVANPIPSPGSNIGASSNQLQNSLATIALVLSIAGILIFLSGIAGMITGIISYKRSKLMGGKGKGLSIAAIIIGFITGIASIMILTIFLAIPALQKAHGG